MLDQVFRLICQAAACLIVLVAVFLVVILLNRSWLAIRTVGFGFLTQKTWNPNAHPPIFGALAFVYGTLATSTIAMLIALPLGVGTAAYLSEIASVRLRRTASFFIEMLAAIPSVIYGFWGIFVLAPIVQSVSTFLGGPNTGGRGILSAGLVLSVMIVPYIAAISYDVCQAVPRSQREGSLALGATRWQTIWRVVLPYARPGIIAGAFLALGRALGETMAVTMLIGNRDQINLSLFAVGDSIASRLANQYMEADKDLFRSVLVELGLLLLAVTVTINTLARLLLNRVGSNKSLLPFAGFRRLAVRSPRRRQRVALGRRFHPGEGTGPGGQGEEDAGPPARPPVGRGGQRRHDVGVVELCGVYDVPAGRHPELPDGEGRRNRPANQLDRVPREMAGGLLDLDADAHLGVLHRAAGQPDGGVGRRPGQRHRRHLEDCRLGHGVCRADRPAGRHLPGGVPPWTARPPGALHHGATGRRAVDRHRHLRGRAVQHRHRVLASAIRRAASRFYGWSGVFALAVMMVPIVIRAAEEALKLVPQSLRNASFALGASHAQTILKVTVPAALPAVITAIFLSIARIAGETAPLLLTAGFNNYWPRSMNDFTPTLPPYIFKFATSPSPNWNRQAWAAAFLLMALVLMAELRHPRRDGQAHRPGEPGGLIHQ